MPNKITIKKILHASRILNRPFQNNNRQQNIRNQPKKKNENMPNKRKKEKLDQQNITPNPYERLRITYSQNAA